MGGDVHVSLNQSYVCLHISKSYIFKIILCQAKFFYQTEKQFTINAKISLFLP